MTFWTRRKLLGCTAAASAGAMLGAGPAAAQQYPTRPIRLIVPFAAGGPTDIQARLFGQSMSQTLGQSFVVENVTGAGGSIGAARVAQAAPDGYTIVMGNLGTHAAAVGIYKSLSYDPRKDFEPIMFIASTPMVGILRKSFPVKSLSELTAYAKANRVIYGSAGIGSISHLTYLLYTHLTGTTIQHVPYRGLSEVANALLAGQVDMTFDQVVTATPHILAKEVIPVAVTTSKRADSIPDVPTTIEAGLPEMQTTAWSALFAPKGTPKAIVEQLNMAANKAMHDPTLIARCKQIGADLPDEKDRTPRYLGQVVKDEVAKWTPLLQTAMADQK
jgi:tripartite-type tricarboxylate transporter receptor subunit TctC